MVDTALTSGDWETFFEFMAATDDIALIKLSEPVRDVAPVRMHASPAVGQVVRIMGRGATGTGLKGHQQASGLATTPTGLRRQPGMERIDPTARFA